MKLGKKEKELLAEIALSSGDIFVSYLLSGRSVSRVYKIANARTRNRAERSRKLADQKRRRGALLKRLEQKNLVKLVPNGDDHKVVLSKRAQEHTDSESLIGSISKKKPTWDGKWTVLMFDMPTQETNKRLRLVHILKRIGFVQVQMSCYVFPYDILALEKFLQKHKQYGEHCHLFRGKYKGDVTELRKKFKL